MSEAKPWAKDWRRAWRDERLDDLGTAAVNLRPCMNAMVVEVGEDGTGWCQNLDGRPMSASQFGRLIRHEEARVQFALIELKSVGLAVQRDDGCWGVPGWMATQETPEAARVRRHRAKSDEAVTPPVAGQATAAVTPTVTPTVTVTDRGAEERGQRTDEQSEEQPRAEPLALTPTAAAPKPTRARRPDPSSSPDVAQVWSEFQALRVALGLLVESRTLDDEGRPRQPPGAEQARELATGLKRAGGPDQLLLVMRRQAESLRRQAEVEGVAIPECRGAEFYDLTTLCTAKRIAKMLDPAADRLDQRRPATPARASPRSERLPAPHHPGSLPPSITSNFGDGEET